ncbi:hypothetical protein FHW69_002470 [Luteibacter sp. Sphag1AF]|uniref:hypothetical protein n=1 Tax=Luteibacter sp. Sphag1AF TaxID=2587031 RepID=UPI001622A920|nr:hypothetical protein [Luteibacter sp. Sphag1AF]MBB3227838.1 hypothetical protein [Luteibacter sp. Sphag1AF]
MLEFLPHDHPLNSVHNPLLKKMIDAQKSLLERSYSCAAEVFAEAADGIRLMFRVPAELAHRPVADLAALGGNELRFTCHAALLAQNFPLQAIEHHAVALAQRVQLLVAFKDPDAAIKFAHDKVMDVAKSFPRTAADIECGKNPGDVLDPYILAATQFLLYGGKFESAINATVAHKALMMIEGLMGHLHEDLIGQMRGNVRVPEPRGKDQEGFDTQSNPFPGADVIQPPLWAGHKPSFHQLKSKTGSAKGGDGKRLGDQLSHLAAYYDGDTYYHALIGNTLRGHRSMAGVLRASPKTVVLVGQAAFNVLTRTQFGPELLLRVYQSAFSSAASAAHYNIDRQSEQIVEAFSANASVRGITRLEGILSDTMRGDPTAQDSRLYVPAGRRSIKDPPVEGGNGTLHLL